MGQRNPLSPQEPEFAEPQDLEEAFNLLERITREFGVGDEFEAAQLLNLARMGRLERQQREMLGETNQLLEQIAQKEFGVDIGSIETGLSDAALTSSVRDGMRQAETGNLIPIPYENSLGAFPATPDGQPIVIDLEKGQAEVPNVGTKTRLFNRLEVLQENDALSIVQFHDTPIDFRIFDSENNKISEFSFPYVSTARTFGQKIARFEIEADFPFIWSAAFSTAPEPPVEPQLQILAIARLGRLQTDDTLTAVPFIPEVLPDRRMSEDFGTNTVEEAISQHGDGTLRTASATQHTWLIENVGNNDIDFQVIGFNSTNEVTVADTDVHGSTDLTNTITLSSGDADIVESGIQLLHRQVRVQNSAAGQDSDVRVQYYGKMPEVR